MSRKSRLTDSSEPLHSMLKVHMTCLIRRDPATGQLTGESNLRFNSSYVQGTNQITGRYDDGTVSITSTSDLQDGLVKILLP